MNKLVAIAACLLLSWVPWARGEVLIIADEIPAMELLASKLKTEENLAARIVLQTDLPTSLADYTAVIVYIHKGLGEPAERAMVDYTLAGGKLIALHHSISSGKRNNKQWFPFLGVTLPEGDLEAGGYKWAEPVTIDLANLAPAHFITSHQVTYPAAIPFATASGGPVNPLPGFTLHESEIYLNHVLTESPTRLLGVRYTDAKTGKVWMQTHAGWVKSAGKGWIVYLMPGHSAQDFENPAYARIVLNAVIWRPGR